MRCFDGDKNHRHEFKLILNSDSVLLSCKCLHVKRCEFYITFTTLLSINNLFLFTPALPLESNRYGIKFFVFENFTATKW